MRKILNIITLFVIFLSFSGCISEVIPEPSPTKLGINVIDDQNNVLYGVSVYLFDNETDYANAKRTGNVSNRIKEGITEQGDSISLVFENLNYNQEYYLFVSYRDRQRFIDLDNFSSSYLVTKESLYPETTTNVNVKLSQAKSSITFYSNNAPSNQFPIKIYLANDSIGVLDDNTAGNPTPTTTDGILNYKVSKGENWYAKSAGGCFWAGTLEVDGTESFQAIKLDECNAGAVSFWVADIDKSMLPIEVTFNGLDKVGQITKSGVVTECFTENAGLSVGRKAGTYSYIAKSLVNGCTWTGELNLNVGDCQIIKLSFCE